MKMSTYQMLDEIRRVEVPTFLEEQPRILFGRTGRELVFLTAGCVTSAAIWQWLITSSREVSSIIIAGIVTALPMLVAVALAFLRIGGRMMEEWLLILLAYVFVPKRYLYLPREMHHQLRGGADEDTPGSDEGGQG